MSIRHEKVEYEEGDEGFFCVEGHTFGTERQSSRQIWNRRLLHSSGEPEVIAGDEDQAEAAAAAEEEAVEEKPAIAGDSIQDHLFLQNFSLPADLSTLDNESLLACLNHFKQYHSNHINHLEKLYYTNLAENIAREEERAVNAGALDYIRQQSHMLDGEEGTTVFSPSPLYDEQDDDNGQVYDFQTRVQVVEDDPNLAFHRRSLLQRHKAKKREPEISASSTEPDHDAEARAVEAERIKRHQKKLARNVPSMLLPERTGQSKPSITRAKFEQYVAELKEREERELKMQFKANPIPKSSIKPRYAKIMKEIREKSLQEREVRKQQLLTNRQEFHFQSKQSSKNKKPIPSTEERQMAEIRQFVANAVSPEILAPRSETASTKEEREKRIKQRAQELLQASSLPSRMAMDPALEPGNRKKILERREKEAGFTEHHTFAPNVNTHIPNFEKMHQDFQQKLSTLKAKTKVETQKKETKPFSFVEKAAAVKAPASKDAILEDMNKDDERLLETRWPFLLPRKKVTPSSPPETTYTARSSIHSTRSVELARKARIEQQKELEEKKEREESKVEEQKFRFAKVRDQVKILMKPIIEAEHLDRGDKLEKMKKGMTESEAVYRDNLNHLKARIMTRPLMFQQLAMNNLFQVRNDETDRDEKAKPAFKV